MFGHFTANLLELNRVIKEMNILQHLICKDIIIVDKLEILALELRYDINDYDSQINLSSTDSQYSILNIDLYYLNNETREFNQVL